MIKTIYSIAQHVLQALISRHHGTHFQQSLAQLTFISKSDSFATSMRMCCCMSR
jgi:hypothetical protein